jgi:tRNA pseudouridine38-40 synthase
MARYFIEVSYDGALYGGFQIQSNCQTIQGEVEKVLETFFRTAIPLTGASRTDAGVHATQNFFHFDTELKIEGKQLYNFNAMLPSSIAIHNIYSVPSEAHARFDASARSYIYQLHAQKNPFLEGRSWYYPFPIDMDLMQKATDSLLTYTSFESFSKKNTQVNTFECMISKAFWEKTTDGLTFHITANRFLRGMIRGLVGTLLQVGRGQITLERWHEIVLSKNEQLADFSTPAHGLYLSLIQYPNYLKKIS